MKKTEVKDFINWLSNNYFIPVQELNNDKWTLDFNHPHFQRTIPEYLGDEFEPDDLLDMFNNNHGC